MKQPSLEKAEEAANTLIDWLMSIGTSPDRVRFAPGNLLTWMDDVEGMRAKIQVEIENSNT